MHYTPFSHCDLKKTVYSKAGIHNNSAIPYSPIVIKKTSTEKQRYILIRRYPYFPSLFWKTVFCETEIHINSTIPIRVKKNHPQRENAVRQLYYTPFSHRGFKKKLTTAKQGYILILRYPLLPSWLKKPSTGKQGFIWIRRYPILPSWKKERYILILQYPFVLKKNHPQRENAVRQLYYKYTPFSHRGLKKTVYSKAGIHINSAIPPSPIVIKKIVYCETGVHMNSKIPHSPIVSKKKRLLENRDTY